MMTEREVFLEALEMGTPEARAAYLQGVCGGDVALRRKVEELLKEHFSDDSLLAGAALEGMPTAVPVFANREVPAQMLGSFGGQGGRYKLLEKIGEGGFGEVWMAEQREPVKRRVALKIIKLGMDSRQIVARFEVERQALAMMDHANIAKIFDAGTTDTGRPYFVMELVRGIKITDYCDQEQLPTRERLQLFIVVCQAIQHAHQKGIIHRDIKPSNILVTLQDGPAAAGVPKVIDFGIAKATQQDLTDKTVFTQFQQFIGTPAYISPEQAEMSPAAAGDIDTRADIYSLGVLLYELLVGQTPFDAKDIVQDGLDALRQIIREKEPLRPSTKFSTLPGELRTKAGQRRQTEEGKLVHQLQGDLDWIVIKCLEKDRDRRYQTANSLAADIQHFLSDEPIVACPPSAGYRLRKFVRRNKGMVLAAGFVLLTLVGGIIGTTMGLLEAGRQRDLVDEQRKELAERNRALQAAQGKERLLNERARQAIETVASETAIEHLTREQELRPEQKDFLDKMIQYYTESVQEVGVTEEERTRQALAYLRMGRLNQVLGRSQDTENAYRRSTALFRQLAADFPNRPELWQQLAAAYGNLGVLLRNANRPAEAEASYAEALAAHKQLPDDFRNRPEVRQALAGIHNNLGILFQVTDRLTKAEVAHAEALAIRQQLVTDFPSEPIFRRALAMSRNNLGWVFQCTSRLKEAESAYAEAIVLYKQILPDFPNRPEFRLDLAQSKNNLGNVLRHTGRPREAEAARAEALVIFRQLVADFPNRPEFRQELADAERHETRSASGARGLQQESRGTGDPDEEGPTGVDLDAIETPKK